MQPPLPPEVWLQVFRWATISASTPLLQCTSYYPFQSPGEQVVDEAVFLKFVLIRVCQLWRALARALFYEDVIIMRGSTDAAKQILDDGDEDYGVYKQVYRLCLPYSVSDTRPGGIQSTESAKILARCSELRVLVRPGPSFSGPLDVLRFEFQAEDCPPLPSLKRLDWWHHNDASRTGGVNSLPEVLWAAPNLQYLSLGGELWLSLMKTSNIELCHLTTLRVRRINILFVQQIARWDLPALRHLVLDTIVGHPRVLEGLWTKFGEQIRTIELGRNLRFRVEDAVNYVLSHFPNLEHLNYYIHFTMTPYHLRNQHTSLRAIGLHSIATGFHPEGCEEYWEHLEHHFNTFCRPSLPNLKKVELHGNWQNVTEDSRFSKLVGPLLKRGCNVEQDESIEGRKAGHGRGSGE